MSAAGNSYSTGGSFKKLAWGVDLIKVNDFNAKISQKGNGINISLEVENELGAKEKFCSLGWLSLLTESMSDYKYATEAYQLIEDKSREINKLEGDKKDARKALNDERTAMRKKYKCFSLVESLIKFEKFCIGFGKDVVSVVNSYEFKGDVMDLVNTYLSAIKNKKAYAFFATSESKSKDGNRVFTNVTLSPNLNTSESWSVDTVESIEDITKEDEAGEVEKIGVKVIFKSGKYKSILINKDNCIKLNTPSGESDEIQNDDLPF